jgi:GTP-binding protein
VILVCDPSRRDLAPLQGSKHFRAGRGRHGEGANRHGARGEDREIQVPPGTQGLTVDGASFDLLGGGQRAVVAKGGRGGHGNKRFANSTRQAPRFAEKGTGGEAAWIELRLKLLADAGLIGLPNAGKSSLLGRLTRAAPKVADYPFTTLSPALGVMEGEDRQAVIADIPGLIEGAAAGAGLGHEFLAHVERCAILVHLVDVAPLEGDPASNYAAVRAELGSYGAGLDVLPELVVLSKRDLLPADDLGAAIRDLRPHLGEDALGLLAVSSATGEGLDELRGAILAALPEGEPAPAGSPAGPGETPAARAQFEVEHRVYRPAGEGGYTVQREDDGGYRVLGRGVELLFERHDIANEEALAYLESRLNEIGVIAALRAAGFEPGDDVRIGEHEFELHP